MSIDGNLSSQNVHAAPAWRTMSAAVPVPSCTPARALVARFLRPDDIPALLRLEHRQWTEGQAADAAELLRRIEAYPSLCVGAFCSTTGEALASLFMKPARREQIAQARSWKDCARGIDADVDAPRTRSLFGISLTSVDPKAAWSLIGFFWPCALKQGWRDIYLGSPIPGLKRALQWEHQLAVEHYARARRGGLPQDPQLRYYHRRGFREIVAVRPGYFPHEASLDYGVVLRGRIPLARLWPLWRRLPLPLLQRMSRFITALI
jgi:hypothetical protein